MLQENCRSRVPQLSAGTAMQIEMFLKARQKSGTDVLPKKTVRWQMSIRKKALHHKILIEKQIKTTIMG